MSQVQVKHFKPCMKPLIPMAVQCARCQRYEKNAGKEFHDATAEPCPGYLYSDCPVHTRPPLPACWREGCESECWKDAWYGRDWFTTHGGYYSLEEARRRHPEYYEAVPAQGAKAEGEVVG